MSTVTQASIAVIPAGTWIADPAHSAAEFTVRHLGIVDIKGRAGVLTATIVGGERPRIEGTVDAASLTTFDQTRDDHLRSPDFFDVERHPELRFVSTNVRADGDELLVSGDLTIKGVTRPVELHGRLTPIVTDPWGNERIGLELGGTIDRTAFGVSWNVPVPGGGFVVDDEVALAATFSAIKAG